MSDHADLIELLDDYTKDVDEDLRFNAIGAIRSLENRLNLSAVCIAGLQAELASARKDGWILAMRLLQSDEVLDDTELAARDGFIAWRNREPAP